MVQSITWRPVVRMLIFLGLLGTATVIGSGCFVVPEVNSQETAIAPGDALRMELRVDKDEIVEGAWRANDEVLGSYFPPESARLRWSPSAAKHDFTLDGVNNPGGYIFEFENTGNKTAVLLFQYRVRKPGLDTPKR